MKKRNGFTLIELLAVIVILAIIALIAIPQIIRILNKARMSSAEDSTYGIVKSAENYITEFMLKNNGELPNEKLTFSCGNEGCSLDNNLEGYNLTDLDKLNYKGTKASSGKVTIENENIEVSNIIINGFTCNYPIEEKAKCYTSEDLKDLLEINNISITPTLNSIKVVLNISGSVSKYEYSIDNINYNESDDNTYTFNNLEPNQEYTVYVRVSNNNKVKESSKVIKTLQLSAPEIEVEKENTWTQSKNVTIKYPSGENLEYSYIIKTIDGNTTIKDKTIVEEETTKIEVIENSIVIGVVTLGSSNQSISKEVSYIDRTVPESSTFTETHTTNSITLTATGVDSESGIYGYQFSIDNGTTWLPNGPQKEKSYTFNNLSVGSYTLKVRAINNTYKENEINELNTTISENKVVNAYTLSYDLNGGTGNIESKVSLENTDIIITDIEPTREDFSFLGWSINSSALEAEYKKGETIKLIGNVTLYAVWKSNKYNSGDALELGGYKWHVISDDGSNVTLLMDAGQIEDMAHCTNDTDASTDCGVDSTGTYYVYSWDNSLINKYLKETLYPELKNKIPNEIVPVSVCIDSSRADGKTTYGGYLKTEIEKIKGAGCSRYEEDYIRLISSSEYVNLSPPYETDANYPNASGITRLSTSSDYANWLYCNSNKCGDSNGMWWVMSSCSFINVVAVNFSYTINSGALLDRRNGHNVYGVRPVITIKK